MPMTNCTTVHDPSYSTRDTLAGILIAALGARSLLGLARLSIENIANFISNFCYTAPQMSRNFLPLIFLLYVQKPELF